MQSNHRAEVTTGPSVRICRTCTLSSTLRQLFFFHLR